MNRTKLPFNFVKHSAIRTKDHAFIRFVLGAKPSMHGLLNKQPHKFETQRFVSVFSSFEHFLCICVRKSIKIAIYAPFACKVHTFGLTVNVALRAFRTNSTAVRISSWSIQRRKRMHILSFGASPLRVCKRSSDVHCASESTIIANERPQTFFW